MEDKTAIENLIKDPNLRKLESQFGGFNIFESIGAVRRELRHSDFLAFLLDPSANHQLFDRFIKPFLFRVAEKTDAVSVIDIDLLNYDDIQIRREWKNIDILIVSEQSEFVCAIENKIDVASPRISWEIILRQLRVTFPNVKSNCSYF
ncbi:MAG: PD-(D/E)XK nuclease family protein [Gammaproteobacteria bacterium]